MRCLALADGLSAAGWRCSFAVGAETEATVPALAASAHDCFVADGMDAAAMASLAGHMPDGADLLVVDHYGWSADQEASCRSWARRILVIDDLADRAHDCDLLLDQTLGREDGDYGALVASPCGMLLGPDFALLRPQFTASRDAALSRPGERPLGRLLVSFGASDPHLMTALVLRGIAATGLDLAIDVIVGADDRATFGGLDNVTVHVAVSDMAALMARVDLVVGTAGVSSWERCCLGLPAIVIVTADNQLNIAAQLERAGAIRLLGNHQTVDADSIAQAITAMAHDACGRAAMSHKAAMICDGLGVGRVVDRLAA